MVEKKPRTRGLKNMNDKLKNFSKNRPKRGEFIFFWRVENLTRVREKRKNIIELGEKGGFEKNTGHIIIPKLEEMVGIKEWLNPDETKKEMTSAEWLMLTLAVYFHDLGMVVTKDEYENERPHLFKNYKMKSFLEWKNQSMLNLLKNKTNIFLYQEFVRRKSCKKNKTMDRRKFETDLGDASTIKEIIEDILKSSEIKCSKLI